jgi:acyl phosphate:glycerol-3-phosphate acyltransferase
VDRRDRLWGRASLVAASYLVGAVPWSQILARRRGVDLRSVDDGTVSGTGLYRVAGFVPLAVAGSLDVAKGAFGPAIATTRRPTLAATAAAAGVAGHNWSVFLRGAGGRGISPALGALAVRAPSSAGLLLGALAAGRLVRRTGFVCFLTFLALVPLTRRLHGRGPARLAAAVLVPLLLKRVTGNRAPAEWDLRTIAHRLVLDRDPPGTVRRTAIWGRAA